VILNIVLLAIVEALGWFYTPGDVTGAEFRAFDGYGAIVWGGLPLYFLMVTAKLLILIGLLSFHPTARLLFLAYVVVTVPLSVLWGFRVSAPLESPFLYLETFLDGVVLALAYYSSVSDRFRKQRA
jgi:hypothetical protein